MKMTYNEYLMICAREETEPMTQREFSQLDWDDTI